MRTAHCCFSPSSGEGSGFTPFLFHRKRNGTRILKSTPNHPGHSQPPAHDGHSWRGASIPKPCIWTSPKLPKATLGTTRKWLLGALETMPKGSILTPKACEKGPETTHGTTLNWSLPTRAPIPQMDNYNGQVHAAANRYRAYPSCLPCPCPPTLTIFILPKIGQNTRDIFPVLKIDSSQFSQTLRKEIRKVLVLRRTPIFRGFPSL